MHQLSEEMKGCIDECLRCYQICLGRAMTHCLEQAESTRNHGISVC